MNSSYTYMGQHWVENPTGPRGVEWIPSKRKTIEDNLEILKNFVNLPESLKEKGKEVPFNCTKWYAHFS